MRRFTSQKGTYKNIYDYCTMKINEFKQKLQHFCKSFTLNHFNTQRTYCLHFTKDKQSIHSVYMINSFINNNNVEVFFLVKKCENVLAYCPSKNTFSEFSNSM